METTRPKFTSPRCFADNTNDDEVDLPENYMMYQLENHAHDHAATTAIAPLQNHKDRWSHMSALAGDHRQEDNELRLNRPIAPQVFKAGLPPQVAARVERLFICMDDSSALPEWLDTLASSCFALQHLHLNQQEQQEEEEHDDEDREDNVTASIQEETARRMRRLYILYRLPDLISIDDEVVTDQERALARPNTPNGQRVNRNDWVAKKDDGVTTHNEQHTMEEQVMKQKGEIVEVTIDGVLVKAVPADPPQESFDEPELVMHKQQRASVTFEESAAEQSASSHFYMDSAMAQHEASATKRPPSPAQSPALLMSEVSEDDASDPSPTTNTYLTRFQVMQTLCSRSEKYLPMEESEPLMLKATPPQETSLSFRQCNNTLLLDPKPPEVKPNSRTTVGTPERRPAPFPKTGTIVSKTPPRLLLTPTQSPGASPRSFYNNLSSPLRGSMPSPGASPRTTHYYGNSPKSPSKGSLTSPFPMQFRSRANKKAAAAKMAEPPGPMPTFSMQEQLDEAIGVMKDSKDDAIVCSKETINDVTARIPSPPLAAATGALRKMTSNRPPPCPGRVLTVPSPHEERRKRVLGRWRNRSQLRSTAMMDNDDDDDASDDDEVHTA